MATSGDFYLAIDSHVATMLFDCQLEPLAKDHSPFDLGPGDIDAPLHIYVPLLALQREWVAILYRTCTEARRTAYTVIVRGAPLSFSKGPLDGYLTQMHEVVVGLDELQHFMGAFKSIPSEDWAPTDQWVQNLVELLNETMSSIRRAQLYYHSMNKRLPYKEALGCGSQANGPIDNDE